ncbi:unnamed protein product (macronuclear) [Paramecium tetraurelia]|uniref:BEACH domain-containing protein n=1 Tax=Paramecium tetraurelia TaxID=5888 RepID=A0EGX5_PARTE|nr:uncharacterized protein GSPATT00026890001 [Paramecium tetraurelia]CAK94566.1 unnamed protein product [Paramecium tetraurelia]|eukprot:XP_001461939.1 hypothetical protein (macronuclear) [Paramecium tetraurelia strain d4-2]
MLQLVPNYHVEMIRNSLKSNQQKLYDAIEGQQFENALFILDQLKSRSTWISGIYLIMSRHKLDKNIINRFLKIVQESDEAEMAECEQSALTQICQQIMNVEMITLLYKYNLEGWVQLSPKILEYLRKSIHPSVPQIFINYFIKQNIELLEKHEQSFNEDFVWTLQDIRTFYKLMPTNIQHPYYQIIQISIYVRMLDLENVPCPISPQTIPIQYPTKLEEILKKLVFSPHKDCLELYVFCLIQLGLLGIVIKHLKSNLTQEQQTQIRKQFMETALKQDYIVDVEVFKFLDGVQSFDHEIKLKVYNKNPQFYENIDSLDIFDDESILNGLMHNFNYLVNQQKVIKQLAQYNSINSLKAIWILHIDGAIPHLTTNPIQEFKLKNFKCLNIFDLIQFKYNYDHLIEALKVTTICIWTDRDIRQEELENKQLLAYIKQCITRENCQTIFKLLFNIFNGLFEESQDIQYIQNQVPYFLELLTILLFEQNVEVAQKQYYLQQLLLLTKNLENVLIIMKCQLVERLIFFLRIESEFQELIIQILINCIKVRFSLQYLQAIAQFMSPYQSLIMIPYIEEKQKLTQYRKIASILGVPLSSIECGSYQQQMYFQDQIADKDLFLKNSTLLLYCLNKVISIQNDQYYYFTGHDSGIIVKGQMQFETQNNIFSIILQFKGQLKQSTLLNWGNQDINFSVVIEDNQLLGIRYKQQNIIKTAKYTLKYQENFIVINFNQSRAFQVNINGNDVLARQADQFDNFQIPVLNFFAVGAKLTDYKSLSDSFRGEMRLLYILDQNINAEDMYILEKKSQNNSILFSQLLRMQIKGRILIYLNTQSQKQDIQFDGLLNQSNQIFIENCQYLMFRGRRQKQTTISKFMGKLFQQRISSNSMEVTNQNSKNVLFLENTTLLDVMKSYGNLDILFFPLHILNHPQCVISVLQLLNTIIQKFGDDNSIQNYLRSDSQYKGIKVLGYLLTVHMKTQGCSIQLLQQILNFYNSLLQCQIIQILKQDCMCIYHEFEFWQYCQYDILSYLYSYLFEQLQNNEELFTYFKDQVQKFVLYFVKFNQQLMKRSKGDQQTYIQTRRMIIKCIFVHNVQPFFLNAIQDKRNTSTEKLQVLKNEILLLLNHLTLKTINDLVVILGFTVRKPQNNLILELLTDIRQGNQSVQKESFLDVMQSQFALKMENDDTILQIIFKLVYGVIIEMVNQNTLDDQLLGPLMEILVKVQVHQINYEYKLLELQQTKNSQQQQKTKEYSAIKSLFIKINYILFEITSNIICQQQTFQVLINLSSLVLKQELNLEKEVLNLLLSHFSFYNLETKQLIIEFFLQSQQYKVFMNQLCNHKELMNFIRELINIETGQTLINYIVLHHIDNIDFSAKKILKLFNMIQQQNNQFMKVILTILLLQNNTNSKQNPKSEIALLDLFMLLPTAITQNKELILSDPQLFVKVFHEYVTYLQKQNKLYSFYPDTEFIGYYEYDPVPFFGFQQAEVSKKYIYPNGGVQAVVLFILFYSLELLIQNNEAKQLLLIWKKLLVEKSKCQFQHNSQTLINNEQIQNLQMKIKQIKIKSQKSSLMQKIKQSVLGEYQLTQYDKYFHDMHLYHVLNFQLISQQYSYSEELYDIFTSIKYKYDNFLNFQSLWSIIDSNNLQNYADQLSTTINLKQLSTLTSFEELNNRAYQIITQFNLQSQQVQQAIQLNGKLSNDAKKFVDLLSKVNSPLKYLELFKEKEELIQKACVYLKLYSFRQVQFAQELSVLLNIYSLQHSNLDQMDNSSINTNNQQSILSLSTHQSQLYDYPKISTNLFNQYRQEYLQIIQKFENEFIIKQLIIQFKVKLHFKQNTHKRGLWYFMNYGDAHLYEQLHHENLETFLELLGKERYSINSYEDSMRRKMFLKVFAKQKKTYEHIQLNTTAQGIFSDLYSAQQSIQQKDKVINNENQRFTAELITQRGFYRGKIRITNEYFMFENFGLDIQFQEVQYKFQKDSLLKTEKQKLIPLAQIKEVFPRSYLAQPVAIELFTNNNKTYLFNLFGQRQTVMKLLSQCCNVIMNPIEQFKKSGIIEKWRRGDITNFQYLIEVNKYGGRTYNDLNQYPIFPWVIANYVDFDISNKDHFRKLDIPIGAINQKRLENFLERFKQANPEDMNMYFIYGTHYSHSAIVMSFLMRMEPFASLHQELQSGRFDKADRLFHSLESQWHSVTNSSSDVKELIPEFFYFSEFLKNKNKFDLGQLQSGTVVSDVTLPQYINTNSPEEMIFLNRLVLESDHVSFNLHNWIDLIFGYKSGMNAQKYNNLYHRLTYSNYVQQLLEKTDDEVLKEQYITQVYYYGQTPQQLFKKDHPVKQFSKLNDQNPLLQLKQITLMISKQIIEIDQLICNDKYLVLITNEQEIHVFNVEHRITSFKIPKDYGDQEVKPLKFNQDNIFLLFDDSLVVGGYSDNSVKVYCLKDLKLTCSVLFHTKVVTSLGKSSTQLLCGSRDTRISVWEWTLSHQPEFILYGHQNEVTTIEVDQILQIILSCDLKGDILIHTLKGAFLKLIETSINDCYQIKIHPSGFILISQYKNLIIYTLQGELFLFRGLLDHIISINVLNEFSPEILILTYDGTIFITSIIQLKRTDDFNQYCLKKYKLGEMEIKMETNQLKKVKELIKTKHLGFMNSQVSCSQFIQANNHRVLIIAYENGQIISLYEQPKTTSLL